MAPHIERPEEPRHKKVATTAKLDKMPSTANRHAIIVARSPFKQLSLFGSGGCVPGLLKFLPTGTAFYSPSCCGKHKKKLHHRPTPAPLNELQ